MRKFEILKMVYEVPSGITPKEIAKRLGVSITNIYTYLKQLKQDHLVQETPAGAYIANKTNEKLQQILELQSMAPGRFYLLIAPDFKTILEKLCGRLKAGAADFSISEQDKIEGIAIPLRIVLKLSRNPVAYCLKINEALVASLMAYHDLKASFTQSDFQELIQGMSVRTIESATKTVESDPNVIKMCDTSYANGDDLFLPKTEGFAPDQRLEMLMKSAEQVNKEHGLFLNALEETVRTARLDQWELRYIYNTNSIEGNTMSEKDVTDYLKTGKQPESISKREIYETNNMRHAIAYLKLKQNEDVNEDFIKEIHFMIQKDIDSNPGNYKKYYNYVKPSSPTTPPQHVKERMRGLIEWYRKNKRELHPFVLASVFHMQFEMIHPFGDGNGRVGRLLINHILRQNNYLPITILEKSKQNYYRAIENRSLPQFLYYMLTNFIDEYRR